MNSESLFTAALGLKSPWQVLDIQFDPEKGRIDFQVGFSTGAKFTFPNAVKRNKAFTIPVHGLGGT